MTAAPLVPNQVCTTVIDMKNRLVALSDFPHLCCYNIAFEQKGVICEQHTNGCHERFQKHVHGSYFRILFLMFNVCVFFSSCGAAWSSKKQKNKTNKKRRMSNTTQLFYLTLSHLQTEENTPGT